MESDTCDIHEGIMSTERAYEAEPVPSLSETITARSLAVSLVLAVTLTVVAMKISLNSGFLPSLSIPACLLGFYLSHACIRVLDYMEVSHLPFTRQENTVIQTCVAACTTIAFSGGFGTFLLAMGRKSAGSTDANKNDVNVEEPSITRMIAFLFLVSFAGIFIIMPFRKVMIIRHQLTFPSGTATAHLINSFNTPQGATQAKMQVYVLFKSLAASMAWSIFQWFFSAGRDCGFRTFPTFGMEAYRHGFFFDFGMTNVGIGMICPYVISLSMLAGSAVSWGILWPYIETKEGDWYPANLGSGSLSGIKGYKVFIGVSMILADGLFNFLSIMFRTSRTMTKSRKQPITSSAGGSVNQPFQSLIGEGPDMEQQKTAKSFDERRRAQVFLRDSIPNMVTIGVYILLAALSTVTIPLLYRQLRYYHVALVYLMAPLFTFCNVYGFGLTDMNLSSTYAKIAMLVVGSWVGHKDGGVIAGLVTCGIMMCTLCNGGDVMQDLKTGYLTLTSPRAVLISELIGTGFGCLINPTVFWVFYKVYKTGGTTGGDVPDVPYARVYRGMAMLSVGQDGLPMHSMLFAKIFFMLALALCMLRELASRQEWRMRAYLPSTVAMAVAFFVPPDMAIGMCVGSLVLWLWERTDPAEERMLSSPVASGLICGDGLGSLVSSLLTLTKATAPICIKFLSRGDNEKLDAFLATLPAT
ncbi:hypothetical protein ZWY2020_015678 [Hordeum vulgare]|nr:hypothetical protein ZWY2020_015678 [Hordeum vulgare]